MANDSETQLRNRKGQPTGATAAMTGKKAEVTNKMQNKAKSKRSIFDSYPEFVQATIWHQHEDGFDAIWRTLPIEERLQIAERLKQEGATFFKQENWLDATRMYTQAAGLFHYVKKTADVEGGLDDNYIELVTDDGEGEPNGRAMRSTCYTNIAQCLLKKTPNPVYDTARRACDAALELDPTNVKALYRRALACEGKVSSEGNFGTGLLLDALEDLKKAESLDAGNKLVREARVRIRATLKEQKLSEQRTFGDCLRDGGLGGSEQKEKEQAERNAEKIEKEGEGEDLQQTLNNAQKLRQFYFDQNLMEKADDMEENIIEIQQRIEDRKNRRMNIYKPHENLDEAIKKAGIDLSDEDQRHKFDSACFQVATEKKEEEEKEKAVEDAMKASGELSKEIREACIIFIIIILLFLGSYLLSGPKMTGQLGDIDPDLLDPDTMSK